MLLKKVCVYEGVIKIKTGLAIKSSNNELHIGGADSEVIKNPVTGEPYIPGSSIKGKMRSSIEKKYGAKNRRGEKDEKNPCGCGKKDCFVCTIFGAHNNPGAESAPTRIIVRDAELTEETRGKIDELLIKNGSYLEEKAENIIDRRNGTAGSPRTMERVPAGFEFTLQIILNVYEGDNEENMKNKIEEGLRLVENSYLGGSGSRGYGQVEFVGEWKDLEV